MEERIVRAAKRKGVVTFSPVKDETSTNRRPEARYNEIERRKERRTILLSPTRPLRIFDFPLLFSV